jgi:hypothetical protein
MEKRPANKHKATHNPAQCEAQEPPKLSQGLAVSAAVPSVAAEDQDMTDTSNEDEEEVKVPLTPTTTAEQAASFPILVPISASDMDNNQWALSDPAARQAYL